MKSGLKITLVSLAAFVLVLSIAIALLIKNANRIIKYELESVLGEGFSVNKIDLKWGRVEASDISFKNPAGKEVFKTDSLTLEADFMGLLRKEYAISNLSLKNPYIFIEIDSKGNLVNPFLQKEQKKGREEKPSLPFFIKRIQISKGSLDYLDRKVSRTPVLTKLRDIEFDFKETAFPFRENFSTYTATASIPGNLSTGIIKSDGKIKLKTGDTDCRVDLKRLDITGFKPYFQKKGDVNVTKGTLDLVMDIKIVSRKITAPGKAILKNLEFETRTGIGDRFLGVPRSALINFLKNSNNEIVVNFTLEGDFDNPKFNLRENFLEKMTLGLAEKLGLSVTKIGESIIVLGAEGAKEVGKGIGESLRKIFK